MLTRNEQDLYLAPRVRKNRLNIDPNSLLPKLPSPSELKPFPTVVQTIFRGHEGRVRSVAIDPVSANARCSLLIDANQVIDWYCACNWRRRRHCESLGAAHGQASLVRQAQQRGGRQRGPVAAREGLLHPGCGHCRGCLLNGPHARQRHSGSRPGKQRRPCGWLRICDKWTATSPPGRQGAVSEMGPAGHQARGPGCLDKDHRAIDSQGYQLAQERRSLCDRLTHWAAQLGGNPHALETPHTNTVPETVRPRADSCFPPPQAAVLCGYPADNPVL